MCFQFPQCVEKDYVSLSSAAFHTFDHKILLSRLQYHLGIHDIALDWCKSYLLNRPQHVFIGYAISKPAIPDYSVPQGSVLGPQWFTVYTSLVRDIILKYNLNYHVYADDTQLYITFKSSQEPADSCITMLEKCIQEIRSRVVTLSRKSCHITPILNELHWLPVSQRIVFKLMLIAHKSVNNIAPKYANLSQSCFQYP